MTEDDLESRFTPTERIKILEEQVQRLMSAVFQPVVLDSTPHPNAPEPNMADAIREVQHELGGAEIDPAVHTPTPRKTELEGQMSVEEVITGEVVEPSAHAPNPRNVASLRATTMGAAPLTRNFRPSLVGYTATMFHEDYPDLDPGTVVEQFFNHHLSRGTTSKNWLEEFFKFAGRAQQWANESNEETSGETDSMGLPVDPAKRRAQLGHNEKDGNQ